MTTTSSVKKPARATQGALLWLLYLCDAGLLIASGLIHLHLWDIAYRHVKTLDVLFLVQFAACLLAAAALLVTRHLLVVAGAALLMAGTMIGFVLARTAGIFGFRLTFSSGLAWTVLIVEAAALVMLGLTAWVQAGQRRWTGHAESLSSLYSPHRRHVRDGGGSQSCRVRIMGSMYPQAWQTDI
jgi:hypothetical protein